MRESTIENYLIRRVKEVSGETRKVKWIARRDAPDRLVLLKDYHCLVELKRPGETSRETQRKEHTKLRRSGFDVWDINSKEDVDELIGYWGANTYG